MIVKYVLMHLKFKRVQTSLYYNFQNHSKIVLVAPVEALTSQQLFKASLQFMFKLIRAAPLVPCQVEQNNELRRVN